MDDTMFQINDADMNDMNIADILPQLGEYGMMGGDQLMLDLENGNGTNGTMVQRSSRPARYDNQESEPDGGTLSSVNFIVAMGMARICARFVGTVVAHTNVATFALFIPMLRVDLDAVMTHWQFHSKALLKNQFAIELCLTTIMLFLMAGLASSVKNAIEGLFFKRRDGGN